MVPARETPEKLGRKFAKRDKVHLRSLHLDKFATKRRKNDEWKERNTSRPTNIVPLK